MSEQEIDKFIESEVIEINGKLFIAKEKATNMLIQFATRQVEKRCAVLAAEKDLAIKTCDRLAEEKIMLKGELTASEEKTKTYHDALRDSVNSFKVLDDAGVIPKDFFQGFDSMVNKLKSVLTSNQDK